MNSKTFDLLRPKKLANPSKEIAEASVVQSERPRLFTQIEWEEEEK